MASVLLQRKAVLTFADQFKARCELVPHTVIVAQLVRALVCGSRGRRFEPGLSPKNPSFEGFFYRFVFFWHGICQENNN